MKNINKYLLTFLRIAVGWHLMYEGISKLLKPGGWSAEMFLTSSNWIFSGLFHKMAESPDLLKVIDFMNIWGLILIGLSLILGLLVRWSSIFGAVLMLFYFIAHPPIPGHTFGAMTEGSYLWINKTLIEFFILIAFSAMPVNLYYGLDRWIKQHKEEKAVAPVPTIKSDETSLKRREVLRDLVSVPVLGAFAYALYKKKKWDSFEENLLTKKSNPDVVTGASRTFNFGSLKELKGKVPSVKIGNMEVSRIIMGGNLIGGWAHARDLLYTSKLIKAYHDDERVMQTMQLAEKCGINTILTTPSLIRIIKKYKHETGGKIQFISDCSDRKGGFIGGIKKSQAGGADAMYLIGNRADRLTHAGKFDEIKEGLALIRSYGKPAGIGAHRIETVKACIEQGIHPDFWVKTLHHHNYWSAQVDPEKNSTMSEGFKDNMFCFKPDETIEVMNSLDEPWIAFKVLAAGAITPKDGFKYAYENGADTLCVGMYDFQIVEDANITLDILNDPNLKNRRRRWLA